MNLENQGETVALIIDDNNPKSNSLLSIEPKKQNVLNFLTELKLKEGRHYQLIPNINKQRDIIYITGASGSGKSFWSASYATQYKKIFPKRNVYLISSLTEDSSIDKIKGLKRIKLTPEFLNEDIQCSDFKESLVIFDDCEALTDKRMRAKVQGILNQLLTIGRHHNVSVCNLTHSACNGAETKLILNESNAITIFPSGLGGRSLKYLLEQYLGLDKNQIKRVKSVDSRWVTIIKSYPMVCLSEQETFVLNE